MAGQVGHRHVVGDQGLSGRRAVAEIGWLGECDCVHQQSIQRVDGLHASTADCLTAGWQTILQPVPTSQQTSIKDFEVYLAQA